MGKDWGLAMDGAPPNPKETSRGAKIVQNKQDRSPQRITKKNYRAAAREKQRDESTGMRVDKSAAS